MKIITNEAFNAIVKKERNSVVKTLITFLTTELVKHKANEIIEIEAKDITSDNDFHYYNVMKLLKSDLYAKKLDFKMKMIDNYRASSILIKIK